MALEHPSHWHEYKVEGGSGVAAAELGDVEDEGPGLDVEEGDGESSAGGDAV